MRQLSSPIPGYVEFLDAVKDRIRGARVKAALAANRELLLLYWQIGKDILSRQQDEGWGARVVERLSADLRREFPGMKGLSSRNLKYMRALAAAWPDEAIVQEVLARIPWYHNITLLEKLDTSRDRLWYARQAIEQGWSRTTLVTQIGRKLHLRHGAAQTNFGNTLPPSQSELVTRALKDPYCFDFLDANEAGRERDIEQALTDNIRDFLLELGIGFAFIGNQVPLEVGGESFFVDLLLYHTKLHRHVVVELKNGPFRPEYAGKLNFYLSAVDDAMRSRGDEPSIGLLLCRSRNTVIVEYSLRDTLKPIGVADWQLTRDLPHSLVDRLPSAQQLEAILNP